MLILFNIVLCKSKGLNNDGKKLLFLDVKPKKGFETYKKFKKPKNKNVNVFQFFFNDLVIYLLIFFLLSKIFSNYSVQMNDLKKIACELNL